VTPEALLAVYEDRVAATVVRRGDRLSLEYDPAWRREGAFPLSLSMPLAKATHGHDVVEAFLTNLLPDNARVLEAWGRRFGVSSRSPFRLLAHVGEDCAGAFAFVRPDRLEDFVESVGEVEWLTEGDLEARFAELRVDASAWRRPSDHGQFSLAGAQRKIALLRRDECWGIPSGRTPTTHILKPPIPEFDGHVDNEHFCLALARALGLPAARSRIERFGDELAVVVERFDRVDTAGALRRLHQEDLCQALGVSPERKYQNDGGPTPRAVAERLRRHSTAPVEDLGVFRDALLLAWLIAGTDAHAKNYALLHGAGGRVRLAPLYDLASALPYPHLDRRRLKLAMKIGGSYRLSNIGRRDLARLGEELGLDPDGTVDRARELAQRVGERVPEVRDAVRASGITTAFVDTLAVALSERARRCRDAL